MLPVELSFCREYMTCSFGKNKRKVKNQKKVKQNQRHSRPTVTPGKL